MAVNHRITSLIFAFAVGIGVSFCSYQWVTNEDRGAQRAIEEAVVRESRIVLESYVAAGSTLELSDPLNRVREAGKVYIYPLADGWEVSGQYRRAGDRRWHPYLMKLDSESRLVSLTVNDPHPALLETATSDSKFIVRVPN